MTDFNPFLGIAAAAAFGLAALTVAVVSEKAANVGYRLSKRYGIRQGWFAAAGLATAPICAVLVFTGDWMLSVALLAAGSVVAALGDTRAVSLEVRRA